MPEPRRNERRNPLDSVSTKILAFVFASTFVTALVISSISIYSTHLHLRREVDRNFPAVLEKAREGLDTWVAEAVSELASESNGGDLGSFATRSRHYSAVARFSKRGTLQVSSSDGTLAIPSSWLAEAEARDRTLMVLELRPGVPTAVVSMRQKNGWVLGALDPSGIHDFLGLVGFGSGGTVHLVDVMGVPIDASATAGRSGPRVSLSALRHEREATVTRFTNDDGEHLLASALAFPSLEATLVIEESFARAFRPILDVVTLIFLSDLLIILTFSVLAFRITTRILEPIDALSEGAQRISQGQIEHEIPDPGRDDEIGTLTRSFNDMMKKLRGKQVEIESANARLSTQYDELLSANEILAQLSITDGLTKLHNHRYFQDHLTREIKRADRSSTPLAMLLIDLDDFKQLNDRLGHAAGDELLVRIARIMSEAVRESDLLARYGGEEFVVVAPNTDVEGAVALGEKIRLSVGETRHLLDDVARPVDVTLSVGISIFRGDRKRFFQDADRALYQAKAEGKNCVIVAEDSDTIL